MGSWANGALDSMAAALNLFATNSASVIFYDSAGTQVGPALTGSASFAANAVSGLLVCRAFTTATATASYTLGTAKLFSNGAATIGTFVCTSGGTADFVFGNLNIATNDSIIINSWSVSVAATTGL